jgi:hypothetical protein
MNLQVISAPDGEILSVSGPLPGAVPRPGRRPDLGHRAGTGRLRPGRAGRQGLHRRRQPLLTPYRGKNKPASQKAANRAHAQLRSPGERANAQLKTRRILRKRRCCPWRAGQLAKAIHVLQACEITG